MRRRVHQSHFTSGYHHFDVYQDELALDIGAPNAAHAQDVADIHRCDHLRRPCDTNIGDHTLGVKSSRIGITTGLEGSRGLLDLLRLELAENARLEARLALPGLALPGVAASNRRRNRVQAARAVAGARSPCVGPSTRPQSVSQFISDGPTGMPHAEPADTDILLTR